MEKQIEWRVVPGWPEYMVSSTGQVKRIQAGIGTFADKVLKPQTLKNGYLKVSLCRDAKRREYLIHRLVALAFIGDPTGKDVCHVDGSRQNNCVENLRIDTRKGNMADAIRHGTTPRGERCGSNRHSQETVAELKRLLDSGASLTKLSRQFDIPMTTVQGIKERRIWGWLNDY